MRSTLLLSGAIACTTQITEVTRIKALNTSMTAAPFCAVLDTYG
jgi:hypothetical protein